MRNPNPKRAQLLVRDCIRNIRQCTFGWVDHNFLHHGYLNRLSQEELLLYYFLITVADRNGVSFYDYERICQFRKMTVDDFIRARDRLCERSLLAYHEGVFQVLALPEKPRLVPSPHVGSDNGRANGDFQAIKDVFVKLSTEN